MGNFLIKPGSLLLIFVIGLVLFGLFGWASETFSDSRDSSLESQEDAIRCSNLQIDFVDRGSNATHQFVYLQTSSSVEELLVEFKGNQSRTDILEDVEKNSIVKASAALDSMSEVNARVRGCDRVFG